MNKGTRHEIISYSLFVLSFLLIFLFFSGTGLDLVCWIYIILIIQAIASFVYFACAFRSTIKSKIELFCDISIMAGNVLLFLIFFLSFIITKDFSGLLMFFAYSFFNIIPSILYIIGFIGRIRYREKENKKVFLLENKPLLDNK